MLGLLRGYLSRHLIRLSDQEKQFVGNYLDSLKPHHARKLLRTACIRTFQADETLIVENQTTDFLAYVLDGHTRILKDGQMINQCAADQILGELTFGLGLPATATVVATEPTTCLVFDGPRLQKLLRRDRNIRDALNAAHFNNACQKLLRSNDQTMMARKFSAA